MKARVALALVVSFAASACLDMAPTSPDAGAPPSAAASAPQAVQFVPGRLLMGITPGANANAIAAANNASIERGLGGDVWMLRVPENAEAAVAQALARTPGVRFAEPDYIRTFGTLQCVLCVPTAGNFMGYKWDLENYGVLQKADSSVLTNTGAVDADMDWLLAWDSLGANYPDTVRVAILDSGIRGDHEELTGRIVGGYNFAANNTNWTDDNGHGTHVAGIVGARGGNGKGMAGNAWGPGTKFLAVKICGQTIFGYGCTDSAIYQGINWAVAQGAKVLNMSIGGPSSSSTVRTALTNALNAGALPVCAAGNDGVGSVSYPANFPECLAVSATDWGDQFASYSNWGAQIDLSAPGGDTENASGYSYILSSYYSSPTTYAFMAGTSMATPQVTGLAALLWAKGIRTPSAIIDHMKSTADDLGPAGFDTKFGYGRINVGRAVQTLLGGTLPPPPPPPGNQAPTANFTFSCQALTCSFTDTSTDSDGTVNAWSWTFGDGSGSTEKNPTHTYAGEDSYTVTLTAFDDDGAQGQKSQTVNLVSTPALITADFTVSCTDLTCQFTNQSTHRNGVNMLANWDMGDGSGMVLQWSPTHTYAQPGTYIVIMVVLAEDFSGWSSKRDTITVPEAPPPPVGPTAGFSYTCSFLSCMFTDQSTTGTSQITTRSWNFGDGTPAASGPTAQHTFASANTYEVTLTVTDVNNLSDGDTKSVTVQAAPTPPTADFTSSCTFLTCTFTDQSSAGSAAITTRSWSFGDGTPAGSGTSVQHTFASANTYQVTLNVTDENSLSDGETKSVTVQAVPVISLTGRGYKVKGRLTTDLTWSGATTSQVAVYRNGVVVALRPNSAGSNNWTDSTTLTGSPTWVYRVCETDAGGTPTSICSPNVTVTF